MSKQTIHLEGQWAHESITAMVKEFITNGFSVNAKYSTCNGGFWILEAEKETEILTKILTKEIDHREPFSTTHGLEP